MASRRVAVMQIEHVSVGILEQGLMTHTAVDGLSEERDTTGLEVGAGGFNVVDVECDRHLVGTELDPERLACDERNRHRARLELGAERGLPWTLPAWTRLEPDDVRVELDCTFEILCRIDTKSTPVTSGSVLIICRTLSLSSLLVGWWPLQPLFSPRFPVPSRRRSRSPAP